jgi:biotin carboxyl carrier protein
MNNTPFQVKVNELSFDITPSDVDALDIIAQGDNSFHILKNQKAYKAEIESVDYKSKTFVFKINGNKYTSKISDKYDRLIDQLGMKIGVTQKVGDIKAPMPGLVLEVSVEVGTQVTKGDKVMILEAMKMENVIKAAGDGIVKAIHITKGTAVEKGQLLIEME